MHDCSPILLRHFRARRARPSHDNDEALMAFGFQVAPGTRSTTSEKAQASGASPWTDSLRTDANQNWLDHHDRERDHHCRKDDRIDNARCNSLPFAPLGSLLLTTMGRISKAVEPR